MRYSLNFIRSLRVQSKARTRKRSAFVIATSLIVALIAISFIFIGCGEPASPSDTTPPDTTPPDTTPPDTTPPNTTPPVLQSVAVNELTAGGTEISFELENPNSEAVQVGIVLTPPESAMIEFDGASTSLLADVRIPLDATGNDDAIKQIRITGLTNNTTYILTITTFDTSGDRSSGPTSHTVNTLPLAPESPTGLSFIEGNTRVTLSWSSVVSDEYYIYRSIGSDEAERIDTDITITDNTHINVGLTNGTVYNYTVRAVNRGGESGNSNTVSATPVEIDSDNDLLIDISSLEWLDNVRRDLDGTHYRDGGTVVAQCGIVGDTDCIGYELMTDLDFAATTSYDSGIVKIAWRPNDTTNPDDATNLGWNSIGTSTEAFATIFDGNGNTISNLYVRRNIAGLFGIIDSGAVIRNLGLLAGMVYGRNKDVRVGGLVGLQENGSIVASYATGNVNGGAGASGRVGGLVGLQENGSISTSYTTGNVNGSAGTSGRVGGLVGLQENGSISISYTTGNVNGGVGADNVGGLVGLQDNGSISTSYTTGNINGGTGAEDNIGGFVGVQSSGGSIVASYASGTVDIGEGEGNIGGFVGVQGGTIVASYATGNAEGGPITGDDVGGFAGVQGGTIVASYATGNANGGDGDEDNVGGFAGTQSSGGSIVASYATGNVNGGAGDEDRVGGFAGSQVSSNITASYATGNANGGAGRRDRVGKLVGYNRFQGIITASYGFGGNSAGSELGGVSPTAPSGVSSASGLDANNAGTEWNDANLDTLSAWNFGTNSQTPILEYADYDGTANSMYACANGVSLTDTLHIPSCGSSLSSQGR